MDKPIFILGCTKSGTTLLRNLFDGHSRLFAIPNESHFFQNIEHWVSYHFRRTRPRKLGFDEMKRKLYSWIEYQNSISQEITDAFTEGSWNLDTVGRVLDGGEVRNLRELSDLYVKAIYEGLHDGRFDESLEFVEKSVENAEFACEWTALYPGARFVHILRNPYSNLVALRRYLAQLHGKYPPLKPAVYSMYNSYHYLYKNRQLIDRYRVVIYEDLISDPEKAMRDLSEFLSIDFKDILLRPTLMGEDWFGNSTSGERLRGISAVNVDRWKKEITDFEIHLVNELFPFVLEDFGFETLAPRKSRHFPGEKEGVRAYVQNRLLWRYMPRFEARDRERR